MNFTKIILGIAAAIALSVLGTLGVSQLGSGGNANGGPGMILTYVSIIEDVRLHVKSAKLPSGTDFPNAGSFGYAKSPLEDGSATTGAAPDGRQLPAWIEFEWSEPPYPGDPHLR